SIVPGARSAALVGPAPEIGGFAMPGLRVGSMPGVRGNKAGSPARITPPAQSGFLAPGASPTPGDGPTGPIMEPRMSSTENDRDPVALAGHGDGDAEILAL